ncbi:MAG: hypothetical protein HQK51_17015 [Oligoflexia bacterium]|nr:hypothetical protein [Oligoflexia bacterium]
MVKKVKLINCKIVKAAHPVVTRYGIYPGPGTIVTRYGITRPTTTVTTTENQRVDIECDSIETSSRDSETFSDEQ